MSVNTDEKVFKLLRELNTDIDAKVQVYPDICRGTNAPGLAFECFELFATLNPEAVRRFIGEIGVNGAISLPMLVERADQLFTMTVIICHVASWHREDFPPNYHAAIQGKMTLFEAMRDSTEAPVQASEMQRYRDLWKLTAKLLPAIETAGWGYLGGAWGDLKSDERVVYLERFTKRVWTVLFETVERMRPRLSLAAAKKRQIEPCYASETLRERDDEEIDNAFQDRITHTFRDVLAETHPGFSDQERADAAKSMFASIPMPEFWVDFFEPPKDPVPGVLFDALFGPEGSAPSESFLRRRSALAPTEVTAGTDDVRLAGVVALQGARNSQRENQGGDDDTTEDVVGKEGERAGQRDGRTVAASHPSRSMLVDKANKVKREYNASGPEPKRVKYNPSINRNSAESGTANTRFLRRTTDDAVEDPITETPAQKDGPSGRRTYNLRGNKVKVEK